MYSPLRVFCWSLLISLHVYVLKIISCFGIRVLNVLISLHVYVSKIISCFGIRVLNVLISLHVYVSKISSCFGIRVLNVLISLHVYVSKIISCFGIRVLNVFTRSIIISDPDSFTSEKSRRTILHNICWHCQCQGRPWSSFPADTLRNNDVVVTSKRHYDAITSKWRRFDVITALSSRHVPRVLTVLWTWHAMVYPCYTEI